MALLNGFDAYTAMSEVPYHYFDTRVAATDVHSFDLAGGCLKLCTRLTLHLLLLLLRLLRLLLLPPFLLLLLFFILLLFVLLLLRLLLFPLLRASL